MNIKDADFSKLELQLLAQDPVPVLTPTKDIEIDGPYGPHVRIVCKPAAPPSCDLVVRVRDVTQPSGWREVGRFNDMSDDFAYTNAGDLAMAERRKILEGEV